MLEGGILDGKIEQSGQIGERQIVKAGEREREGSRDPIRNTMCVRAWRVRREEGMWCLRSYYSSNHMYHVLDNSSGWLALRGLGTCFALIPDASRF